MAAANTYTPIFTTTLSSTASSVTFSSIPSTYTDLILIASPVQSADYISLQFNGDTGTSYSITTVNGQGATAVSNRQTSVAKLRTGWYAYPSSSSLGNYIGIASIMNYANTTTYKTVLSRANNSAAGTEAIVGLWRSSAAITSMTVLSETGNIAIGSTFSLYGITAA